MYYIMVNISRRASFWVINSYCAVNRWRKIVTFALRYIAGDQVFPLVYNYQLYKPSYHIRLEHKYKYYKKFKNPKPTQLQK